MEKIHESKLTKARKPHKCIFCCDTIEKGSEYFDQVNLSDYGEIYHARTHIDCSEIAKQLDMYRNGPIDDSHFREYLIERYYKEFPDQFIDKIDYEENSWELNTHDMINDLLHKLQKK